MNYLWGAVNAISAPYQYYKELPPLNPSTLTGAIDVIVIRRSTADGGSELACSPFHVRFGKWQVLRPAEKKVNVSVNGKLIPFNMKIGDAGEAFFVFETEGEVPDDLITSPLLEPTKPGEASTHVDEGSRFGAKDIYRDVDGAPQRVEEAVQEPDFLDLNASNTPDSSIPAPEPPSPRSKTRPSGLSLLKPVSDERDYPGSGEPPTFLGRTAGLGKVVVDAIVETEKEKSAQLKDSLVAARDLTQSITASRNEHNDPLHVDTPQDKGDEILPKVKTEDLEAPDVINNGDVMIDMGGYHSRRMDLQHNDGESSSAIPFPSSSPTPKTQIYPPSPTTDMSQNYRVPFPSGRADSAPPIESPPRQQLHRAATIDVSSSPPADEYMWEWGAFPQKSPMRATFPKTTRSKMAAKAVGLVGDIAEMSGESDEEGVHEEFQRSKSLPPELQVDGGGEVRSDVEKSDDEPLSDGDGDGQGRLGVGAGDASQMQNAERTSWVRWWRRGTKTRTQSVDMRSGDSLTGPRIRKLSGKGDRPALKAYNSVPLEVKQSSSSSTIVPSPDAQARDPLVLPTRASLPDDDAPIRKSRPPTPDEGKGQTRFAKTLRLTSDQLKQLDLQPGANTITFSLSTSSVAACTARIFVWEGTDQVVVSDIDGTITKSDALGHVFTMIGRDWTHLGVAKLYTDICRNGYKIMYLTSRAIGQADSTRYYLQGIKQNDYQLPEGPVIMSPDRLMASLHREVIMRKPEVFKMACLRDIQRLFSPAASDPFYAGFGNRITDALSYRSVNIPSSRIFTIDSNGEVKMELLELAGYRSPSVQSYIHMTDLVDQMFPPIQHKWESEFTDNTYWKAPMPEFPLPDLAPPSPALSARSDTSTQSALARLRNFSLRSAGSRAPYAALPPPAAAARRGRGMGGEREREPRLRQLSSLERLGGALAGVATPSRSRSPESSSETYLDSEGEGDGEGGDGEKALGGQRVRVRVRVRTRTRSMESMPGSLPGSRTSLDEDDEEGQEEDLEFGAGDEAYEGEGEDEDEEAAEQAFDEDLLAAGEMENVPFL